MKCISKAFQILRLKGPLQPAYTLSFIGVWSILIFLSKRNLVATFFHTGGLTVLHRPSLQDMTVISLGEVKFNQRV